MRAHAVAVSQSNRSVIVFVKHIGRAPVEDRHRSQPLNEVGQNSVPISLRAGSVFNAYLKAPNSPPRPRGDVS